MHFKDGQDSVQLPLGAGLHETQLREGSVRTGVDWGSKRCLNRIVCIVDRF
jgi:hypothetical protein